MKCRLIAFKLQVDREFEEEEKRLKKFVIFLHAFEMVSVLDLQ